MDLNGTVRWERACGEHPRSRDDRRAPDGPDATPSLLPCQSSSPSNLRFHPRLHAIDTFPKKEQDSPLADRLGLDRACFGRIFTVYWCIRATFLYDSDLFYFSLLSSSTVAPLFTTRSSTRSTLLTLRLFSNSGFRTQLFYRLRRRVVYHWQYRPRVGPFHFLP